MEIYTLSIASRIIAMPETDDKSESRLVRIIYVAQILFFAFGIWNYTA